MWSKIQALLDAKNLTVLELSKSTGIPYACLMDYKNKSAIPRFDKMEKIAKYFNTSLDYFRTDCDDSNAND